MEAKSNQLEVWAELLVKHEMPQEMAKAVKFGPKIGWEEGNTATPIANFQAIKQLAKKQPPEKYVVIIQCTCGVADFYSDAMSGVFAAYVCECGKRYAPGECQAAYKRGVDDSIKRLTQRCQTDSQT